MTHMVKQALNKVVVAAEADSVVDQPSSTAMEVVAADSASLKLTTSSVDSSAGVTPSLTSSMTISHQ